MTAERAKALVAEAETALREGRYGGLLEAPEHSYEWGDAQLHDQFMGARSTAKMRANDDWNGFITENWDLVRDDRRDDPLLDARYAEARSRGGKIDRARALSVLESLAERELLVEGEAWAALARLRAEKGDEGGAALAAGKCRELTKRDGVCP